MVKSFAAYCAALGAVLLVAGIAVHVLMGNQYRANVSQRLAVMTHDAEEAVEETPPGAAIAPALARVLRSSDEGVAVFDARGRQLAAAGQADAADALHQTYRGDGTRGGWIVGTVSNQRVSGLLRELDAGLAIGTVLAMLAGGLIITWISARAMARVQSALQRVYRFTGDASHELRTPLAAVITNADLLALHQSRDGAISQNVSNIRQAARQMRDLMDALLLLARADERAGLDVHAIEIDTCVEAVVDAHRAQAAAKGVALSVRAQAGLTIYGQPEQIARIVGNLIENAIRYTPEGGSVGVTCRAERGGAAIEVADTGPGIAPSDIGRVFDRFWRARGTDSSEGFGLGLAIVRSLAQAHGGNVLVRSTLGKGASFTVKLPVRPVRAVGFSTIS